MVATQVLETCDFCRVGSSPTRGTKKKKYLTNVLWCVQIVIEKYIIIYSVRNSGVEFHSDEMDVDGSIPSVPTTKFLHSLVVKHITFNYKTQVQFLVGELPYQIV